MTVSITGGIKNIIFFFIVDHYMIIPFKNATRV